MENSQKKKVKYINACDIQKYRSDHEIHPTMKTHTVGGA